MLFVFLFKDPATTEIYTLSLHDALPISAVVQRDLLPHQGAEAVEHDGAADRRRGVEVGRALGARAGEVYGGTAARPVHAPDRKSTRLNFSHAHISYAGFCLKKKNQQFTS